MNRIYSSFFCERCGLVRRFTKRDLDRTSHRLATVLTCGLWGVVWWQLQRRAEKRRWRCCICGAQQEPKDEPLEAQRLRERRSTVSYAPIAPRRNRF